MNLCKIVWICDGLAGTKHLYTSTFLLLSFNDLNHICYSIYSSDHYYIIINRILLLLSWYFGITFHVCMENRS